MTYREVLDYLYTKLPMYQRIGPAAFKKDLTNTIRLCGYLGNPHEKFRSVHIAGTNGKGSSSHMIASVLQSAGYKTGLYTSPHLKDFTERIRINGQPIGEREVVDFTERIQAAIDEIDPSFFELTVAMAFDHFSRNHVDIAVIETGLGGRFDSTNVVLPLISLITGISPDHQDMLGNTIPEIAFEKAGIIKTGIQAVVSERNTESGPVFIKKAEQVNAPLSFAEDLISITCSGTGRDYTEYHCRKIITHEEFNVRTDLPGDYQIKNIPGVLTVIDYLKNKEFNITREALEQGLLKVRPQTGIQGRWQVLSETPLVICDVGHNEEGIRWIVRQLEKVRKNRLHIIFGMVKDKNPEPILRQLPADAFYYFCQAGIPRAKDAEELASAAEKFGLHGMVKRNVNEALSAAMSACREGDVIFVGGSTFVVAELSLLK